MVKARTTKFQKIKEKDDVMMTQVTQDIEEKHEEKQARVKGSEGRGEKEERERES